MSTTFYFGQKYIDEQGRIHDVEGTERERPSPTEKWVFYICQDEPDHAYARANQRNISARMNEKCSLELGKKVLGLTTGLKIEERETLERLLTKKR